MGKGARLGTVPRTRGRALLPHQEPATCHGRTKGDVRGPRRLPKHRLTTSGGALRTRVTGRPVTAFSERKGQAVRSVMPVPHADAAAERVRRNGSPLCQDAAGRPGVGSWWSPVCGCSEVSVLGVSRPRWIEESPPGADPGSAASAVAGLRRGAGTRCRTGVGFRQRRAPFLPATTPTYYEIDLPRTLARSQQDDSPHPCAIHGSARPAEMLV